MKINKFLKTRIATFIWGLCVVYFFTRQIDLTSKIFLTQVIGNTFIMWYFIEYGESGGQD